MYWQSRGPPAGAAGTGPRVARAFQDATNSIVSAVRAICQYGSSSQFAVPDLVDALSQDLPDQHLDGGVE